MPLYTIINGAITMENNTNESMSREELRNQKRNQLNNDQEVTSYDEPKKKKKRKHRRHRKFWLSLLGIIVLVIVFFIWIGSRSSLTGSWVEISNANGTTYTSVTDIDELSTLTIKSGKYTYTANNDSRMILAIQPQELLMIIVPMNKPYLILIQPITL